MCGVLQHIEEAGVHSGDSACAIPPHSLGPEVIAEIERQTEALGRALKVKGLMNIQFAVKGEEVYLIEVNPRASRTVPFVAKAIGVPVAKIAARVMAGEKLSAFDPIDREIPYIAVKGPVFPFARFPGADPVLGPEMKSTGEVMGLDATFDIAFAKALLGAGMVLPQNRDRIRHSQGRATRSISSRRSRNCSSSALRSSPLAGPRLICKAAGWRSLRSTRSRRAAAHRRPAARRRCRFGLQHHRGLAVAEGQPFDPRDRAPAQGAIFHDGGGEPCRGAGDRGGARPRA